MCPRVRKEWVSVSMVSTGSGVSGDEEKDEEEVSVYDDDEPLKTRTDRLLR
jgi:hypothetical protein